jgi:dipeptidyl aminopeptidase/acylaminoacyl peptidase
MKRVIALALVAGAALSCATGRVDPDAAPPIPCTWGEGVDVGEMWEFRQVVFRSGGLRIGALLTKPKGPGPFPAYIHNHGSMTIQEANGRLWGFPMALESTLVPSGYVVLRPARRGYLGSDGTTTTYTARGSSLSANNVIYGAYEEAEDVKAAFAFLATCPFVDRQRIAIGGHSVGGLVTVIAAAQLPRVRAVAIMKGGINWTQGGVNQGAQASVRVWQSEAPKIKVPVHLLYGEFDTQISPDLGRSLEEVLKRHGTPVEFLLRREGHNWSPGPEIVSFLDENLKRSR